MLYSKDKRNRCCYGTFPSTVENLVWCVSLFATHLLQPRPLVFSLVDDTTGLRIILFVGTSRYSWRYLRMSLELRRYCVVGGNAVSAFLSWRLQATNACDVTLVWKNGYQAVAQYGISFKWVDPSCASCRSPRKLRL